jgi:hypothetical protein
VSVVVPGSAHKGCAANDVRLGKIGDDFFSAETVLRRKNRSFVEEVRDGSEGFRSLCAFTRDNAEIEPG